MSPMNKMKVKQNELSVYAQISVHQELMDTRHRKRGLMFGSVEDICRQYGIKYKDVGNEVKFTGPKHRLRLFVEKLHFAGVPYHM